MNRRMHRSKATDHKSVQAPAADGLPVPLPSWLDADNSWKNAAEERGISLVVLDSRSRVPTSLIARVQESAAVLVLGPRDGRTWREEALAAGAFGCLSAATPAEDRANLLLAAIRYQAARSEISALRQHCDRICYELVQSFGLAMEKLAHANNEARTIRDVLEDIRVRIVRTLV